MRNNKMLLVIAMLGLVGSSFVYAASKWDLAAQYQVDDEVCAYWNRRRSEEPFSWAKWDAERWAAWQALDAKHALECSEMNAKYEASEKEYTAKREAREEAKRRELEEEKERKERAEMFEARLAFLMQQPRQNSQQSSLLSGLEVRRVDGK